MRTYKYITAIPIWKDNRLSNEEKRNRGGFGGRFVGDDSIVYKMFPDIESALSAMKEDGTCLRERNWEFRGYYGWFFHHDIPLETLQREGFLSDKTEEDSFGKIYHFKI